MGLQRYDRGLYHMATKITPHHLTHNVFVWWLVDDVHMHIYVQRTLHHELSLLVLGWFVVHIGILSYSTHVIEDSISFKCHIRPFSFFAFMPWWCNLFLPSRKSHTCTQLEIHMMSFYSIISSIPCRCASRTPRIFSGVIRTSWSSVAVISCEYSGSSRALSVALTMLVAAAAHSVGVRYRAERLEVELVQQTEKNSNRRGS